MFNLQSGLKHHFLFHVWDEKVVWTQSLPKFDIFLSFREFQLKCVSVCTKFSKCTGGKKCPPYRFVPAEFKNVPPGLFCYYSQVTVSSAVSITFESCLICLSKVTELEKSNTFEVSYFYRSSHLDSKVHFFIHGCCLLVKAILGFRGIIIRYFLRG